MDLHKKRLLVRRIFRRRRKQVVEMGSATESSFDRHILRRLIKLVGVRRFIVGWVGLVILLMVGVIMQSRGLSSLYQVVSPAPGGMFREGAVGAFTNANPLYAQTNVDVAVSKLVFSSLLKYDNKGALQPDIAESMSFDNTETLYTIKLKRNITWHDGTPLTAKDVVFTFKTIQNPDTRSHLQSSWKGITIDQTDDYTVTFKLPTALSAFTQSLTTGIIPEHMLATIPPSQLRSSSFNNETAVGTGPFLLQTVEIDKSTARQGDRIAMQANPNFYGGPPKLERFIIRSYQDSEALVNAYNEREVDAMVGLSSVPENIDTGKTQQYDIPLTSEVMVFFKTNQEILKDPVIRNALVMGADKQEMFGNLPYPLLSVDAPLLRSQVGYDKSLAQVTNKKTEANAALDAAGWIRDPASQMRVKDGKKLTFKLFSAASSEFTSVSGTLQKQWRELGAEVEVVLQSDEEITSSVSTHNYDALLYGVSIGADPDVYAYWHSTQFDPRSETRLNLSEYKSPAADRALEAGRTRSDAQLRQAKYRPFLEAWRNDAPALALYQPRFLYLSNDALRGLDIEVAHTAADRYANVVNWTIRNTPQTPPK